MGPRHRPFASARPDASRVRPFSCRRSLVAGRRRRLPGRIVLSSGLRPRHSGGGERRSIIAIVAGNAGRSCPAIRSPTFKRKFHFHEEDRLKLGLRTDFRGHWRESVNAEGHFCFIGRWTLGATPADRYDYVFSRSQKQPRHTDCSPSCPQMDDNLWNTSPKTRHLSAAWKLGNCGKTAGDSADNRPRLRRKCQHIQPKRRTPSLQK